MGVGGKCLGKHVGDVVGRLNLLHLDLFGLNKVSDEVQNHGVDVLRAIRLDESSTDLGYTRSIVFKYCDWIAALAGSTLLSDGLVHGLEPYRLSSSLMRRNNFRMIC